MASSGSQLATGRLATEPSTVSGPACTHASVRPGAGKWIRSQVESSERPVARTCWPACTVAITGPVSGHG